MSSVVVVDDSEIDLGLFTHSLEEAGFSCIGISQSEIAFDIINEKQPDFVLLDLNMPNISGIELCRQLKSSVLTRDIPVLFISGDEDTDHVIATMCLGSVNYLRKPVQMAKLIQTIHQHELIATVKEAWQPALKAARAVFDKYERRKHDDNDE